MSACSLELNSNRHASARRLSRRRLSPLQRLYSLHRSFAGSDFARFADRSIGSHALLGDDEKLKSCASCMRRGDTNGSRLRFAAVGARAVMLASLLNPQASREPTPLGFFSEDGRESPAPIELAPVASTSKFEPSMSSETVPAVRIVHAIER